MIKLVAGTSILAVLSLMWAAYLLVSIGQYKEHCNTRLAEVAAEAQQERADAIERERERAKELQEQLQVELDNERERRIQREREASRRERELITEIENFETQEAIAWREVRLPDEVLQSE